MQLEARRLASRIPYLSTLAMMLAACGGGGGGGGGSGGSTPSAPTYGVSGTVSGLASGTLVLQVAGKANVNVTANGNIALASGLRSGATYAVSVATAPDGHTCTVANGTGTIASANVTNVQVSCTTEVLVSLSAPANNTLVPLDGTQNITASIANVAADRLTWTVLPEGQAANVTITAVSSTSSSAVVEFRATVPATYTVRVTSQDDATKTAQMELRVHNVYTAIDGYGQGRVYLRADGRVVGTALGDAEDSDGAPTGALKAVAQGERFRLGIRTDGTVVAWGDDIDNVNAGPTTPPADLTQVASVAAGSYFSLAIREDGTLVPMGRLNGHDAQLPDGFTSRQFITAGVMLATFAAIDKNGAISVWNAENGTLVTLPDDWQGRTFRQLCATGWHIVALDSTGAVRTWNPTNQEDPEMDTPPATDGPVSAVYCGDAHAALVQENGRVMTWGADLDLGAGAFDSNAISGFPRIKGASLFTYFEPYFLSESGAIIDRQGNIVTAIDSL